MNERIPRSLISATADVAPVLEVAVQSASADQAPVRRRAKSEFLRSLLQYDDDIAGDDGCDLLARASKSGRRRDIR